jgi:hypothetical protein
MQPRILYGRSRRRALLGAVAVLVLAVVAAVFPILAANAVHDTGVFQLDGSILHDNTATYSWSDLFTSAGVLKSGLPNATVLSAKFFADYAVPDASYFTQNGAGVKDTDAIANWGCKTQNNPTAKDNLLNAYVAFVQIPSNAPDNAGDVVLYLASERQSNNGNSFAGFWLFKSAVSCNPTTGAFTGVHSDGDLLVVSNYTNGGTSQNVTLYKWQTSTSSLVAVANGGVCGSTAPDQMCAIANATTTIAAQWPPGNTPAPSGAPAGSFGLQSQTFVETGLDLTSLLNGNVPCFTYFQAETRSSQTLSATLKDFDSGSFSNCVPPTVTTSLNGNGTSSVVVGSPVKDTATLSGAVGIPKGTLTYSLYTDSACTVAATSPLFGNGTNSDTVTLNPDGTVPASPTLTFTHTSPPTYYWQASYSGDATPTLGGRNLASMSACTSEPLTITPEPTGITTTPQPSSVTVGGMLNDSAMLSGLVDPVTSGNGTGSITFQLFDPSDATCAAQTGEPVYTQSVTATANGSYSTNPGFASNVVGVWHWVALYSGDVNNKSSASTCTSEAVSVGQATPKIATTPTPTTLVVGSGGFSDTADVTLGYHPGDGTSPDGTVTFKLYGPFDSAASASTFTCVDSGAGANLLLTVSDVGASTKDATSAQYASNPTPSTSSYTPTQVGQYQWVAYYNGNANNAATNSVCDDTTEVVTVTAASPTINTKPSPTTITIGNDASFSDTATVSGGYFPAAPPNGTVTFELYGPFSSAPGPASCVDTGTEMNLLATDANVSAAATPAPTQTSATYNSPGFTPSVVGIYQWVATYNPNPNNMGVAGKCGTTSEQVTVQPATPPIASTIMLGDTVKVSPVTGAGSPTGTVSFSLYGPFTSLASVSCTGTPVTTEGPALIDANGEASTPTSVAVAAGIYAWQVTYTSTAPNYSGTSTTCTAEMANISYEAPSPIS